MPAPVIAEPKKTGWIKQCRVWAARCAVRLDAEGCSRDERPEDALVVLGQGLGEPSGRRGVVRPEALEARRFRAEVPGRAHRDRHGGQPSLDLAEDPLLVGAGPVDLVDEDQCRNREAPQRPHQDARLGLDALDRGDHEDAAVEDPEDAIHLGDEVRVPRCVDEVDRELGDDERRHGRADRDAAGLLERQRVGLRRARVDAAELGDAAGCVEEAL